MERAARRALHARSSGSGTAGPWRRGLFGRRCPHLHQGPPSCPLRPPLQQQIHAHRHTHAAGSEAFGSSLTLLSSNLRRCGCRFFSLPNSIKIPPLCLPQKNFTSLIQTPLATPPQNPARRNESCFTGAARRAPLLTRFSQDDQNGPSVPTTSTSRLQEGGKKPSYITPATHSVRPSEIAPVVISPRYFWCWTQHAGAVGDTVLLSECGSSPALPGASGRAGTALPGLAVARAAAPCRGRLCHQPRAETSLQTAEGLGFGVCMCVLSNETENTGLTLLVVEKSALSTTSWCLHPSLPKNVLCGSDRFLRSRKTVLKVEGGKTCPWGLCKSSCEVVQ